MKLSIAVLVVLLATLTLSGATKTAPIAPPVFAHPIAMFLSDLSNDGKRQVTFRASAFGTRFFFEERAGVTVYKFVNGQYVKEAFVVGVKLQSAMKRYEKR
jgi:hypothetical protein